ncbi:MAG TPA: HEAT repeat domain-containing protein [Gemmataceae bacterium]|nr:HEAT repeat domain-containing protein [Gemmataceae bacterium]
MTPRIAVASAVLLAMAGVAAADPPKGAKEIKDPIQLAIKGGQTYLRNAFRAGVGGAGVGRDGTPEGPVFAPFAGGGHQTGIASLAGLALLESGVPASDSLIMEIARGVRDAALRVPDTYDLSLMIMFFDRLGLKSDEPLIQFLTLRLLSGQCADGTWSYTCDGIRLDPVEERRLASELIREPRRTPDGPGPEPKKKGLKPRDDIDFGEPKKEPPKPKEEPKEAAKPKPEPKKSLHPALEKYVKVTPVPGQIPGGFPIPGGSVRAASGDHSNTQFATVGLWCGRRHAVDVADALAVLDKHYRGAQGPDGGWTYTGSGGMSGAAMTCAGLMGLAMGFGAKNLDSEGGLRATAHEEFAKDRSVSDGLKFLGNILAAGPAGNMPGGALLPGATNGINYYFMWSLERVAMVYGVTTIGKVDWYEWGAKAIVASQNRDGSWHANDFHSGSPEVATSFALLFLCRANLADDLSNSLKGKVKDPGTSRLIGGGDLSKIIGGSGSSGSKRADPGASAPRPKVDVPTPPPSVAEGDRAGKLANALVAATGAERDELLRVYRESKGGEYTDALARAAGKLSGDGQAKVRDALAARLARMNAATLIDLMNDRDRELRRGAALAAGTKPKERIAEFADALIRRIADDESIVVQAARASLKALSGEDFGPEAGSPPTDRGKALVAWKKWWEGQRK